MKPVDVEITQPLLGLQARVEHADFLWGEQGSQLLLVQRILWLGFPSLSIQGPIVHLK